MFYLLGRGEPLKSLRDWRKVEYIFRFGVRSY